MYCIHLSDRGNILRYKITYIDMSIPGQNNSIVVHKKARTTNYFWLSSVTLVYICKYPGVDFFNAEEKIFSCPSQLFLGNEFQARQERL